MGHDDAHVRAPAAAARWSGRPRRRWPPTTPPASTAPRATARRRCWRSATTSSDLQERLFAEGVAGVGPGRRVLLVLQGMDTSGKGGVLRHTVGLVDPQGVRITSFKAPTEEEKAHDFLWRIRRALPAPGTIGVFDRSHYEDVLIARVRELAPAEEIERRYDAINEFETELARGRHHDHQVHAAHLRRRPARAAAGAPRQRRPSTGSSTPATSTSAPGGRTTAQAYEIALERTNTEVAPWHVDPERPQVVPQPRHRPDPARHPGPDGAGVAGCRLRRRGAAGPPARRGRWSRDPHRLASPATSRRCARAAACPGSSRPTTSAPTSASSGAPARACACSSPRSSSASWPAGSACAPRGWWRSTWTPRSPATRPTRRSRTCSTPARASTSGVDFLPGAFGFDGRAADRPQRPGVAAKVLWLDAFCANVDRTWRNPNLLFWHGDLWVIDHGASLYFHHGWGGGVDRPRAVRRASPGTRPTTSSASTPAGSRPADAELRRPARAPTSSPRCWPRCPTRGSSRCRVPTRRTPCARRTSRS